MKKENKEGCRGCLSYYINDRHIPCRVFQNAPEIIKKCPCRMCLIKSVCICPCDDFENLFLIIKVKQRRNKLDER